MAYSRYDERRTIENKNELYSELFDERGVKFIKHYITPKMRYPDLSEFASLDIGYETWKLGDRYWKLAEREYGRPEMWWVIAWFNKRPTESHNKFGDQILIPRPLEKVLALFGL